MPDFDIVVSDRESSEARLIVETKLSQTNVSDAANQLKKAMLRMSCPVGLLITPQSMTLFLDRYISQSEDSIESIGPFETQDLLHFERKGIALQDAKHFEEVVQRWLENLPNSGPSQAQKDGERWEALRNYVLPALETGAVRAASPRYW